MNALMSSCTTRTWFLKATLEEKVLWQRSHGSRPMRCLPARWTLNSVEVAKATPHSVHAYFLAIVFSCTALTCHLNRNILLDRDDNHV